uniref:Polyprotein 1 n=1 Tax=Skokie dicistro-like virus TaxID=2789443 RepID=A0A7S9KIU6_9VIRU|nr:polyprotein 1 [Skokie dicistro-like virus]
MSTESIHVSEFPHEEWGEQYHQTSFWSRVASYISSTVSSFSYNMGLSIEAFGQAYATVKDKLPGLVKRIFVKTSECVLDTYAKVKRFIKQVIAFLSNVIDKSYSRLLDYASEYVLNMFEMMKNKADRLLKEIICMFFLTFFSCLNFIFGRGNKLTTMIAVAINAIVFLMAETTTLKWVSILSAVTSALTYVVPVTKDRYEPQMDVEDKKLVNDFGKNIIYIAVLGWCALKGLELPTDAKGITSVLQRHGYLGRAMMTWEKINDGLVLAFEQAYEVVFRLILKRDYASSHSLKSINELHASVLEMLRLDNHLKIGKDYETTMKIEAMYFKYMALKQVFAGDRKATKLLEDIGPPIYNMYQMVTEKNPKASRMRKEPVVVLMTGKTGVGKTSMLYALQVDLLKICGKWYPERGTDGLIYSRNSEQEFWDGYADQPICVVDEFAQRVDSAQSPNIEFFELIRAANIFPYQLHSAAINEKATNCFKSEFMVLTSNMISLRAPSIQSVDAVERRIHLDYEISVIPCVQSGLEPHPWRLDVGKLQSYRSDNHLPTTDMSHYQIKDKRTNEVYNYDQFLVQISLQYKRNKDQHDSMNNAASARAAADLPDGCFSLNDELNRYQPEAIAPSGTDPRYNNVIYAITLAEFVMIPSGPRLQLMQQGVRVYQSTSFKATFHTAEEVATYCMMHPNRDFKGHDELPYQRLLKIHKSLTEVGSSTPSEFFLQNPEYANDAHYERSVVELQDKIADTLQQLNEIRDDLRERNYRMSSSFEEFERSYTDAAPPDCDSPEAAEETYWHNFVRYKELLDQLHAKEKWYNPMRFARLVRTAWFGFDDYHHVYERFTRPVMIIVGLFVVGKALTYLVNYYTGHKSPLVKRSISLLIHTMSLPFVPMTLPMVVLRSSLTAWEVLHFLKSMNERCKDCKICDKISDMVRENNLADCDPLFFWVRNKFEKENWSEKKIAYCLTYFRINYNNDLRLFMLGDDLSPKLYMFAKDLGSKNDDELDIDNIPRLMKEKEIPLYELLQRIYDMESNPSISVESNEGENTEKKKIRFENQPESNEGENVEKKKIRFEDQVESNEGENVEKKKIRFEDQKPESNEGEDSKRKQIRFEEDSTLAMFKSFKTEGFPSKAADDLRGVVRSNMWLISIFRKDGDGKILKVLGTVTTLKGYVTLINEHYLISMKYFMKQHGEDHKYFIELRRHKSAAGSVYPFDVFISTAKRVERAGLKTELFTFKLPKSCGQGRDLTKHMFTPSNLSKMAQGIRLYLVTMERDNNIWNEVIRDGIFQKISTVELSDNYDPSKIHVYANTCKYTMTTKAGDCGSPIIVNSDQFERKLIGFHIGGNTSGGCASIVCVDDINKVVRNEFCEVPLEYVKPQALENDFPLYNSSFSYIGAIEKPIATPSKTKLRRSPIFNEIVETKVAPARLRPALEPDGPMLKGLMKNAMESFEPDRVHLESAVHSYKEMLFRLPPEGIETKVLSYEDAVRGVEGNPFFPPCKRTTSAGFPYSQQTKKKGKTQWMGDNEWDFTSKDALELKYQVETMEDQCRKGIIPEVYYVDTLKDEKRPIEKVQQGKTRVFSAAPQHFVVLFRKYFLGFEAFMMRNKIANECGVGMNPYSKDWKDVVNHLDIFGGETMIAGDFSNFDGTINFYIMDKILDIINEFYSDDLQNQKVRRVLWEHISKSKHIVSHFVYQFTHSQPSGNPATAVTNSMYNSIAVRYCYSEIFGNAMSFNKYVRMIAYGDDNVISVAPFVHKRFNPSILSEAFKELAMTYTSETKGQQQSEFRKISEVTFLKRGFEFDEDVGHWFAPLSIDSISEMTNWIKTGPSDWASLIDNCKQAINELYFHDESTFVWFSGMVNQKLRERNKPIIPLWDWDQARYLISSGRFHELNETAANMRWAFDDQMVRIQDNSVTAHPQSYTNPTIKIKSQELNINLSRTQIFRILHHAL